MKIAIVGPGSISIPPLGWGAVEILIWNLKLGLEELGHTVQIINAAESAEIMAQIDACKPDFVHIQYENYVELFPKIRYPAAITSHYAYLPQPKKWGGYSGLVRKFAEIQPVVFCLSDTIKDIYQHFADIPQHRLAVVPNGVNFASFAKVEQPLHGGHSIYLGKVTDRKRQYLFQSIDSLWYAGPLETPRFIRFNSNRNYLGEWSRDFMCQNLTHYGNLVILSDGEAQPLVCMEGLAGGLGLVISEFATANLDLTKKFITVIPEYKTHDIEYVEEQIIANRSYALSHRQEILAYAKEFDYENILHKYYLPNVENQIKTWQYGNARQLKSAAKTFDKRYSQLQVDTKFDLSRFLKKSKLWKIFKKFHLDVLLWPLNRLIKKRSK